ncbi:hypothetical protein AAVH_08052 [Aphelenchoides avenae]|nr:hypothetical protein AAVH_08052 [Aphelenchus avenae]
MPSMVDGFRDFPYDSEGKALATTPEFPGAVAISPFIRKDLIEHPMACTDHVRTQFPVEKLVEVADHNRIIPSEKLYEPSEADCVQQANVEDAKVDEEKIPSKI